MKALDVMPQLRVGTGKSPAEGGCVVQVASYLWNGEWRDDTPCVHPVLRSPAIRVNDTVDEATRQKLYLLIPRLMGTASDDKALSVALAIWCAKKVQHLARKQDAEAVAKAIEAAEQWLAEPSEAYAAYAAYYAANAAYAAYYAANAANAAYDAYAANDANAAYDAYAANDANAANDAYAANAANDAYAANAYYAVYAANAANDAYAANAANAANDAYAAAYAARYDMLVKLIDEYDRLTGRTDPHPVRDSEWSVVQRIMASA